MTVFIDTHAHLDFKDYNDDRAEVIQRAYDAGVHMLINVGTCIASSKESIALAEHYPGRIFAAVGIHPHEAGTYDPAHCDEIAELCRHESVVALGEIGLDYFRDYAPHTMQRKMFVDLLQVHKKTQLPIVIHARDSYEDIFTLLRAEVGDTVHGVMHCFSGNAEVLQEALDLGLYISFAGHTTFKKSDELRRCAKLVPDDRIMIETDCPFLTPQSRRGKRNEPALMIETAECIAAARGISVGDLGRITTRNARALFGLPLDEGQSELAYKIRNTVYINVTSACSSSCIFCPRTIGDDRVVKGHNLCMASDPSAADMCAAIDAYHGDFDEICFCGFGEPLMRVDFVKEVAAYVKKMFPRVPLRVDTNGQGNLINKRNIVPELAGLIDAMSISLNAQDSETYKKIVQPHFESNVFEDVKEFIREAKNGIPSVTATCLNYPGIDTDAVRRIAEDELGVAFRLRIYNEVG